MVRYDGLLNLFHSLNLSHLTHPTILHKISFVSPLLDILLTFELRVALYQATTKLTNFPGTTITFLISLPAKLRCATSDSRANFSKVSLSAFAGT